MKLIHIHLPKTAGTSLRESISVAHPDLKICPARYPKDLASENHNFDIYSGHFSMDDTKHIPGSYITVMRNPIDRFISVYYFWKQLYESGVEISNKTKMANKYSLLEFAKIFDEPLLVQEFFNRITWQIAYSFELHKRFEYRSSTGHTEQQVLNKAINNLDKFSLIGFQELYSQFLESLNRKFSLNIKNTQINVTKKNGVKNKPTKEEIDEIQKWVYLDIEFYNAARGHNAAVSV